MPIADVWRPDIYLYNSVSSDFDAAFPSQGVIHYTGKVNWVRKYQIFSKRNSLYF